MPSFDRKNKLEKTYQEFLASVGCKQKGLECLRAMEFKKLVEGSTAWLESLPPSTLGFGPSADGEFIRQIPALELATGNFVQGIESLIVSHVADEAKTFIVEPQNETTFRTYQDWAYGNNSALTDIIDRKYPIPGPGQRFKNNSERFGTVAQLTSFTCHTRWISEAYRGRTWNVQYSLGSGLHGSDVAATFYGSENKKQSDMINALAGVDKDQDFNNIAHLYQAYLVSHARAGDPNVFAHSDLKWPKVSLGPVLSNVLNVAKSPALITDPTNSAEDCDFWLDVFSTVTNIGGYAPPGAVRDPKLMDYMGNASMNFMLS
jgi:Carboxylesterase family